MGNFLGMFPPKTKRIPELSKQQMENELHPAQRIHVGIGEQFNSARSIDFKRRQRSGTAIGIALFGVAVSTYVWTLLSLKQEKLGPEFDVRIEEPDTQKS